MNSIHRVNILGCPFDEISFAETVDRIRYAVLNREQLQVVPGSIDFVMKGRRDPVFASQLWNADLVIADGVPIVWAATMLGSPLRGRVSGTELVWSCAQISAEVGCGIAMIGGAPGVSDRAAGKMRERFKRAVLYPLPTPFPLSKLETDRLVEQIRMTGAGIVLAALGAPRQERWVQANLRKCGAYVGIGVGSAFDIISGDKPRAPRWMQHMGLEWLQRMLREPRRLGRRYLIEDSPFLIYLAAELLRRSHITGGRA